MTPPLTDAELDALRFEVITLEYELRPKHQYRGTIRWWQDVHRRIQNICKYAEVKDLWNAVVEKEQTDE